MKRRVGRPEALALVVLVTAAAFTAERLQPGAGAVLRAVCGIVVVGATLVGARRSRDTARWAWALMAGGLGVWVVGDALWDGFVARGLRADSDWFNVPNVLYLLMYPVLFVAIVLLMRSRFHQLMVGDVADCLIVFFTAILVMRIFVVDPHFSGDSVDSLFNSSYPFADAALLAAVAWLVVTPGLRGTSEWLLCSGLLVTFAADLAWDFQTRLTGAAYAVWITPLYPVAYALIGAAALCYPVARSDARDQAMPLRMPRVRVAVLCGSLGLLPVAALVGNRADTFVSVATSGLAVTVGIRFALLVRSAEGARREAQVSEHRFRTLAASAPVGIFEDDADFKVLYANAEGVAFLGDSIVGKGSMDLIAHIVDTEDRTVISRAMSELVAGRPAEARIRMRNAHGQERWISLRGVPSREGPGPFAGAFISTVDITDLKDAEAMLSMQATHDLLTGLPNRRMLFDRLTGALSRLSRQAGEIAVLFLDLDGFKEINDLSGHEAGDEVLRVVAGRLLATVRAEDTVSRFGGDEFVVVLERLLDRAEAVRVADKLIRAIEAPITLNGGPVGVSGSVGIAVTGDPRANPDSVVNEADTAMYVAKETGRGRVQLYQDLVDR